MKHLGLFEGIGGFSLAAKWAGWETVAWCETNPFCQKVLKYHFPEAEGFGDITKTDFTKYANQIDIVTGGFPCQPFSLSGLQKGEDDERFLFYSMLRAVREIKPKWVVAENVYGLATSKFREVFENICTSMEAEGYEVQPCIIPASAVGAPHQRERVWFIAKNCNGVRRDSEKRKEESSFREQRESSPGTNERFCAETITPNSDGAGLSKRIQTRFGSVFEEAATFQRSKLARNYTANDWSEFPTQSPVYSRNDGISDRLVGVTISKHREQSIKGHGNAIVPQVAYEIFKAINEYESIS